MSRRILGKSDKPATPRPTDPLTVELTLYTRRGCHLCDEMQELLQEFAADYTYAVETVDIDTDPALRERFNEWVPALYLGESEICHHHLDLSRLRAVISAV